MCPTVEHILHREKENTGCRIFDDAITGESWKRRRQSAGEHRALRQLTAKFKKELAERKRREQGTVEGEAAEQSEQAAELFTWEGAERLTRTHGELSYRKQEETKAPRSETNPSIDLSYPRGEAAQKACRQGQRGRPQPRAGQRAQAGASARAGQGTDKRNPHTDRRCAYTPPCAATQTAGAQGNCLSAYRHKAH